MTAIPVVAAVPVPAAVHRRRHHRRRRQGVTAGRGRTAPTLLAPPPRRLPALPSPSGARSLGDTVGLRVRVPHDADGAGADARRAAHGRDGEPALRPGRRLRRAGRRPATWWEVGLRWCNPRRRRLPLPAARRPAGSAGSTAPGVARSATSPTPATSGSAPSTRCPPGSPTQVVLPGLPRPVRRATGRPARRCPDWAIAGRLGRPGACTDGRRTACQLYGGTSTGSPSTSTISRTLGANLLYLTPVFEARSNHRYDAVSLRPGRPAARGRRGAATG